MSNYGFNEKEVVQTKVTMIDKDGYYKEIETDSTILVKGYFSTANKGFFAAVISDQIVASNTHGASEVLLINPVTNEIIESFIPSSNVWQGIAGLMINIMRINDVDPNTYQNNNNVLKWTIQYDATLEQINKGVHTFTTILFDPRKLKVIDIIEEVHE